jgi:hypothetical protein
MRFNCTRFLLLVGFALALLTVPIQAGASQCSTAAEAGNWAYTYAGTIFTQSGPLPAASVGHFRQYADGNITGSQTRSVAGQSGAEDIAGTVSINKDCTASATIKVLVSGQLQRTAVLARAYDSNSKPSTRYFSVTDADGRHQRPSGDHHRR